MDVIGVLDDDYDNLGHIPGGPQYSGQWAEAAAQWRKTECNAGRLQSDLAYGTGERERFDLFQPHLPGGTPPKGLMVFIHGGYWMRFDRKLFSHLAAGAQAAGWAVAMPSYTLCPQQRVSATVRQIARALPVMAAMVPGPLVIVGHSAGGHLAARMLQPGMLPAEVAARLRRVVPISPLADLRPLLQTTMNEIFRLDMAEAAAESPLLMKQRLDVPVTIWVGAKERPVFKRDARDLAQAWEVDCIVAEGRHHLDVIEPLEIADSQLLVSTLA